MKHFAALLPCLLSCSPIAAALAHPPATATATPTPTPTPTARPLATPTPPSPPCQLDMIALPTFCIDRYEAPNVGGEFPFALKTAYDGETWCAEHGKRLCTENEWVRACAGSGARVYPYGDEHRVSVCNDDRPWIPVHWESLAQWPSDIAIDEAKRLFQAEKSGLRAGCVSEDGVHDLTGNVAEWVRRSDAAPRPGYDHVLKGCYWAGCYHEAHPNCEFRNSAHPSSFRTYEAGFRCCADRGST
jgi:formylglycine-generating enzyme required for sulfatase activity